MGLLAWWRRRGERLMHEARWTVACSDETIRVTDATGDSRSVAIAQIAAVIVETNDSGPWGADLWWLAFDSDGAVALGWPQGATDETAAIDRLMALPGFDMVEMTLAMASTDNAAFTLWRRDS